MSMIQIGILGMAGVLFAVQLKGQKAELAVFVCIGISLLIFCNVLGSLKLLTDAIREIGSYIQVDGSYIKTLIKMLGITYIAEFSSGICKDAGYQALAVQIEMFGKITILVLSLPILLALLRTIQEFLS